MGTVEYLLRGEPNMAGNASGYHLSLIGHLGDKHEAIDLELAETIPCRLTHPLDFLRGRLCGNIRHIEVLTAFLEYGGKADNVGLPCRHREDAFAATAD